MATPLVLAGTPIAPGTRVAIDFPLADLYTCTPMSMPVQVVRGQEDGPVVFVSAAIHGDEINGVEIIHRLLREPRTLRALRGTLICIPVVNVFGFINQTRYLPDGRDLNRSFPGSARGSLTARIAHLFLHEIAARCDYGIDLHTAAAHRHNLPHVRANLADRDIARIARAFPVPVLVDSNTPDGSLRRAAGDLGVKVVLFEGGERLRFDEHVIRIGVRGVLAALRTLGMLPARGTHAVRSRSVVAEQTRWQRAARSGIHRIAVRLGQRVRRGDVLGVIADPFGALAEPVRADIDGIVIGQSRLPLVNEGDALFHIARTARKGTARRARDGAADTAHEVDPLTY